MLDIRLVQRAAVDDRLDAVFADRPHHQITVGDRADHLRLRRRDRIQPDDVMAKRPQARRERAAQPA